MNDINKQLLDAAKSLLALHDSEVFVADPWNKTMEEMRQAIASFEQAQDTRCECCGYMTYHREHMSCIRAAKKTQSVNHQQAGMYHKFTVYRNDGRDKLGGDRHGAQYFVLDVTHDKFAKPALATYVAACRNDYPALADDITTIIDTKETNS